MGRIPRVDRTKMVANLTTTAQTVTKMTAETTARMEKGLTIMIAINSICTAQLVLNISLGLFFFQKLAILLSLPGSMCCCEELSCDMRGR